MTACVLIGCEVRVSGRVGVGGSNAFTASLEQDALILYRTYLCVCELGRSRRTACAGESHANCSTQTSLPVAKGEMRCGFGPVHWLLRSVPVCLPVRVVSMAQCVCSVVRCACSRVCWCVCTSVSFSFLDSFEHAVPMCSQYRIGRALLFCIAPTCVYMSLGEAAAPLEQEKVMQLVHQKQLCRLRTERCGAALATCIGCCTVFRCARRRGWQR